MFSRLLLLRFSIFRSFAATKSRALSCWRLFHDRSIFTMSAVMSAGTYFRSVGVGGQREVMSPTYTHTHTHTQVHLHDVSCDVCRGRTPDLWGSERGHESLPPTHTHTHTHTHRIGSLGT